MKIHNTQLESLLFTIKIHLCRKLLQKKIEKKLVSRFILLANFITLVKITQ